MSQLELASWNSLGRRGATPAEMALQLRTLPVFTENLGSIPKAHMTPDSQLSKKIPVSRAPLLVSEEPNK